MKTQNVWYRSISFKNINTVHSQHSIYLRHLGCRYSYFFFWGGGGSIPPPLPVSSFCLRLFCLLLPCLSFYLPSSPNHLFTFSHLILASPTFLPSSLSSPLMLPPQEKSIEWFIGPGFLAGGRMIRLHAHPFLPLSRQQLFSISQSSCVSRSAYWGERGWARSRIIRQQESWALYKSFNTLYPPPPCLVTLFCSWEI